MSKKAKKAVTQPAENRVTYSATGQQTLLSNNIVSFASENGVGYYEQTGDAATRNDRRTLQRVERQLDDQNMIYAMIKDRMCSNLLGAQGFTLQARTGNPEIDKFIEDELWREFTDAPEYRDLFSWKDLQYQAMREIIGPGDCGFIKLATGQLQAIESEWIAEPSNSPYKLVGPGKKIEQGVEMTNAGKVTGYWITLPDSSGYSSQATGRRIDRKNFIYCHGKPQRFSRTRPIPPFIQVASSIWRMDDILNSEAIGWQLLSKYALIINQEAATEDAYDWSVDDTESEVVTAPVTDRVIQHDTGMFFYGNPGETIEGVDRNLPGKDFPASVKAFMQQFSARYGLPYETMFLDWSNTNYSSGKAALTQATQMVREWQTRLVEQFHQPVYEWKIRQWVAEGLLPSFATVANHEWYPPQVPWLDPKEDAEAWSIQINGGMVTYSSALKQAGKDRDSEISQRVDDIQTAMSAARDLMSKNPGQVVDWRLLCGYTVGKTEAAYASQKTEDVTNDTTNN